MTPCLLPSFSSEPLYGSKLLVFVPVDFCGFLGRQLKEQIGQYSGPLSSMVQENKKDRKTSKRKDKYHYVETPEAPL